MNNSKRLDAVVRNISDQAEAYLTRLAFNEMARVTPTMAEVWLEQLEEKQRRAETKDQDKINTNVPQNKISNNRLRTRDVIDSLLNFKKYKRVKETTLGTYRKRSSQFERVFPWLPEEHESIMNYLNQFDGETERHRRNHHDLLRMLYKHAIRVFGWPSNPLDVMDRPIVTERPFKTLSLGQVCDIDSTLNDLTERVCLDLLLGHGWRQIEVRRILAQDILNIRDGFDLVPR